MTTIAFFNNKGGVGKTSLVYHLAWMYASLDVSVLAADLDPQANLTSMFLDDDEMESLWPENGDRRTIYGALQPLLEGTGDVAPPHLEEPAPGLAVVPAGTMRPVGYVVMQHAVRLDRPVKAYGRWMRRIPSVYGEEVAAKPPPAGVTTDSDPNCLAALKHYRSLMPMAQEARKPMFALKPADGAFGGHARAVQDCYRDFRTLALKTAKHCGIAVE